MQPLKVKASVLLQTSTTGLEYPQATSTGARQTTNSRGPMTTLTPGSIIHRNNSQSSGRSDTSDYGFIIKDTTQE